MGTPGHRWDSGVSIGRRPAHHPGARSLGFSLPELLVVVAVLLILASLLIVLSEDVYVQTMRLQCQHRLEQLGHACQMFANGHHGRFPKAWNNVESMPGGGQARRRWYQALASYVNENTEVFACPLGTDLAGGEASGTWTGTGRILYYNLGQGRPNQGGWGVWGLYTLSRAWLTDPDRTPSDPSNVPFEADYGGGTGPADLLTAENLATYDQVWILGTITQGNGFLDSELQGLAGFHNAGGAIHLFAESHYGSWTDPANALSDAVGYGIRCEDGVLNSVLMEFEVSDPPHPVMVGVTRHATNSTPAKLELGEGAVAVAWREGFGTLIAAYDAGAGRVLVHSSFTTPSNSRWPHSEADCKQYCLNAAEWLFGGRLAGNTECSYGYNNQLGDARKPGADTIVIMDYVDWEIDRDNVDPERNDPDVYIATRHAGRANALMGDGGIRSLRVGDISPGMWTPIAGD